MNIIVRLRRSFQPSSPFTYLLFRKLYSVAPLRLLSVCVSTSDLSQRHNGNLTASVPNSSRARRSSLWTSKRVLKLANSSVFLSTTTTGHHVLTALQNACKVMAKDLVRTRRYVQKFYQMRTQLQAVGLRIQTLRSNQQMADAMRGATRVRAPLFNSRLLIYPSIGHGFNEPRPQSPCYPTNHE